MKGLNCGHFIYYSWSLNNVHVCILLTTFDYGLDHLNLTISFALSLELTGKKLGIARLLAGWLFVNKFQQCNQLSGCRYRMEIVYRNTSLK